MKRQEYYLNEIEKIIDDYRYYSERNTSIQDKIEEICLIPTDDMEQHEISCLLDVLRKCLICLGILPKFCGDDTDLSDCTERDLKYMLGNIVDKITNIMYDKEVIA